MHKKINAILIPLIILSLVVCFAFSKDKDRSEKENRMLAKAPSFSMQNIVSGQFMEDVESWLCDQFPLRDMWIEINTRISLALGKTKINGVYIAKDNYLIEEYETGSGLSKISRIVDRLKENLGENAGRIRISFMAVPTAYTICEDKLPKGAQLGLQLEDLKWLNKSLNCDVIELASDFKDASKENSMYFRLDHHWTIYGAKVAANAYLKSVGLSENTSINEDFALASDSFKGTLYNKVGECGLGSDSIYYLPVEMDGLTLTSSSVEDAKLYDKSKLGTSDEYAFFLGGNCAWFSIKNEKVNNGRRLVIIKDSYANSMVSFLIDSYEEITLIDPRYYEGSVSEFAITSNATEILFLYNMNTLGKDTGIRSVK